MYRDIVHHGVARCVLEVRYALPMTPRIRSQGVVAALIDRQAMGQLVAEHVRPQDGFAVIAGQDRAVVVDVSSPEHAGIAEHVLAAIPQKSLRGVEFLDWNGVSMAVAYERSPTFGWLVAMGVPRHVFFEQSRRITVLFVIVAAIVVTVGVPVALLLAFRTSRPLVAIARLLSEGVVLSATRTPPEDPQGLDPLTESVYELTQRHASLRRLLDEQRPLVRQVVVERLLRGDFPTENELHATLRHYELEVVAPSFGVFCVVIDGYYDEANDEIVHEFVVKSTLVKEQLDAILPHGSLTHSVSLNRLAAVVQLSTTLGEAADRELGEVVDRVSRILNACDAIRCFVIQGTPVGRLFEVPESFRVASSSMHSMRADGSVSTTDRRSGYYYPPDLESRLVAFVQMGRVGELTGVLETIRDENLSNRCLSVPVLKGLADELEGTRNKIIASLEERPDHPWPPSLTGLSMEEYVLSQLDGLLGIARLLADQVRPHHKHRRAILDFIGDHYTEPTMGLKRLSREFSLSEVYLSYLFPQIAGTTFSSYLEQLRMSEAADLLRSSRMTVDEIARGVGYASADVFRRAFKRRYGVSPSSFAGATSTGSLS